MQVPAVGPKDAKLVIVGEAPGAQEESKGQPFVGGSGQLLTELLVKNGIDRSKCYITNVVKIRPPNNNFKAFYAKGKRSALLEESIASLKKELQEVRPNLILALGNEALKALTSLTGITKWRGSVLETPYGKLLPALHPANILRMYENRTLLDFDLRRAALEMNFPEIRTQPTKFHIRPNFTQVMTFLEEMPERFTFDIETFGKRVRCLGIGISSEEAMCIPFIKDNYDSYWSIEEEKTILSRINDILSDPDKKSIAQNFPFDASILELEFGIEVKNLFMDTMVAQHCCYSELPKSLDFMCSIYTKRNYYAQHDTSSDDSEWVYNCYDCVVTYEVSEVLSDEMESLKVEDFFHSHALPSMIALTKLGHRGLPVNEGKRKSMIPVCEKKIEEAMKVLPDGLNPLSPKQVMNFLYKELKLRPVLKNKKPTSNDDALQTLMAKHPQYKPFMEAILTVRRQQKHISTYLKAQLNKEGRLACSFHATGTVTGRVSSSKTIHGEGANLQNQPSGEFRRIYEAGEGKLIMKADLSQAEARVVAWLAPIQSLVKKLLDPSFDIHRWNASIVFSKKEEDITKEERNLSKPIVHGTNYMMRHITAAKEAGVTPAEAKRAMNAYYSALPELRLWHERTKRDIYTKKKLVTPFGRIRIFFGRLNEETIRSGVAFIPQSTVGDIINKSLFLIEERFPGKLICQVHDEVVLEIQEDEVEKAAKVVRECCELPIKFPKVEEPLVIPVEIKVGKNWYDVKEI